MNSVTGRINSIKQPKGGYVKPSEFEVIDMNDGIVLNETENVHAAVIGIAVDYLTRFALGTDAFDAFKISLKGSALAEGFGEKGAMDVAETLLQGINELDDVSIINACKLVTFDTWFRNPTGAMRAKSYKEINPDKVTIQNVQTLVKRSIAFFDEYGEVVKDGFSFEPTEKNEKAYMEMMITGKGTYGGYTATVSSGDGDFLTADTLWDFKVSKSKPTSKHTLQLLMYWIMGQHSGQKIYKSISKLGIFNPRLNKVYRLSVDHIPHEVIETVEKDVICYE